MSSKLFGVLFLIASVSCLSVSPVFADAQGVVVEVPWYAYGRQVDSETLNYEDGRVFIEGVQVYPALSSDTTAVAGSADDAEIMYRELVKLRKYGDMVIFAQGDAIQAFSEHGHPLGFPDLIAEIYQARLWREGEWNGKNLMPQIAEEFRNPLQHPALADWDMPR